MKVDQLMEAIEQIDDRYVEESAYGVRRKSRIPWGMIITAACFCLAIGATIFMQSMGILPHLSGPSDGTSQPTTPSTTETTIPQPTVALPSPETFFSEPGSLHNIALGGLCESAEDVQFFYLLGKGDIGKSVELTEQEKKRLDDKLKRGIDYSPVWRLTGEQMNNAFWSVYGLTWEQVIANFDPDSYKSSGVDWSNYMPVYLEETGYYYGYCLTEVSVIKIADIETVYHNDGTIDMYYTHRLIPGRLVAKLQAYETGYYILSVTLVKNGDESTEPTEPPRPTTPPETTVPTTPPEWEKYNALFTRVYGNWYNQALTCEYDSPQQMQLYSFFYCGFPGETTATDAEWAQLKDVNGFEDWKDFFRLPVDKMNAVLTEYFGITLDDLEPECFDGLTYLESTNCYYFMTTSPNGIENFLADNVEELSDGTVRIYYNISYLGDYVVTLKPDGDGYRILSNVLAESSRPYAVDAVRLDALLQEVGEGNMTKAREKEVVLPLLGTFLEDTELFLERLKKQFPIREAVVQILNREVQYPHPRYTAYKKTIRSLLTMALSEEDKEIVYLMAFYNGLANYLSTKPTSADYALLFDMMLYSDGAFSETCAYWMEQYCKGNPSEYVAAMGLTKEEHWRLYAFRTVAFMKQEDRALIKASMIQVIEDVKYLDGYGIKDMITCAEMVVEYCDDPTK